MHDRAETPSNKPMKELNTEVTIHELGSLAGESGKEHATSTRKSAFDGLFSATFVLSVATGVLYVLGYSYQSSYLHSWGVDGDLFTLSVQQYLIYGSSVLSVGGLWGGLIWLVIIAGLLLVAYLTNRVGRSISIPNIIKVFWKWIGLKLGSSETELPNWYKKSTAELALNFIIMLLIVCISLFSFSIIHLGSMFGKSIAKTELETFSNKKVEYSTNGFSKIKRFKIEQKSFDAFVIAASDKFYALYVPAVKDRRQHILTIPTASILSVTAKAKQPQSKLPELQSPS
ncbi:MAG: hypothetical protein ACI8ZB_003277 [Desulforhopalus sp.]|jgi:hypothetical protein